MNTCILLSIDDVNHSDIELFPWKYPKECSRNSQIIDDVITKNQKNINNTGKYITKFQGSIIKYNNEHYIVTTSNQITNTSDNYIVYNRGDQMVNILIEKTQFLKIDEFGIYICKLNNSPIFIMNDNQFELSYENNNKYVYITNCSIYKQKEIKQIKHDCNITSINNINDYECLPEYITYGLRINKRRNIKGIEGSLVYDSDDKIYGMIISYNSIKKEYNVLPSIYILNFLNRINNYNGIQQLNIDFINIKKSILNKQILKANESVESFDLKLNMFSVDDELMIVTDNKQTDVLENEDIIISIDDNLVRNGLLHVDSINNDINVKTYISLFVDKNVKLLIGRFVQNETTGKKDFTILTIMCNTIDYSLYLQVPYNKNEIKYFEYNNLIFIEASFEYFKYFFDKEIILKGNSVKCYHTDNLCDDNMKKMVVLIDYKKLDNSSNIHQIIKKLPLYEKNYPYIPTILSVDDREIINLDTLKEILISDRQIDSQRTHSFQLLTEKNDEEILQTFVL